MVIRTEVQEAGSVGGSLVLEVLVAGCSVGTSADIPELETRDIRFVWSEVVVWDAFSAASLRHQKKQAPLGRLFALGR